MRKTCLRKTIDAMFDMVCGTRENPSFTGISRLFIVYPTKTSEKNIKVGYNNSG